MSGYLEKVRKLNQQTPALSLDSGPGIPIPKAEYEFNEFNELLENFEVTRRRLPVENLLIRLRTGHEWLAETQLKLLEERDVYEGVEGQFLEALDTWANMDKLLRDVFSYEGCVMGPGPGCPDESPVSCLSCGGLKEVSQAHRRCRESGTES